jgi:hypothetical protein
MTANTTWTDVAHDIILYAFLAFGLWIFNRRKD